MANLKNITDVPVVESAEGLNLIVNDNGAAKQVPANLVGGTQNTFIIDITNLTPDNFMDAAYGNTVKEALLNGQIVFVYDGTYYFNIAAFRIRVTTTGEVYLDIFIPTKNTTGGISSTLSVFPPLLITL